MSPHRKWELKSVICSERTDTIGAHRFYGNFPMEMAKAHAARIGARILIPDRDHHPHSRTHAHTHERADARMDTRTHGLISFSQSRLANTVRGGLSCMAVYGSPYTASPRPL